MQTAESIMFLHNQSLRHHGAEPSSTLLRFHIFCRMATLEASTRRISLRGHSTEPTKRKNRTDVTNVRACPRMNETVFGQVWFTL